MGRPPAHGHLEKEPLPVKLERPQIGKQGTLDDRQRLEGDRSARALEERLDEVEIDQRDVGVFVRPGELPHDRVDDTDHHRAGSGEIPPRGDARRGGPGRRGPGGVERAAIGIGGGVGGRIGAAAEELDVEAETLGAHVKCREVERLELILPVERIEVGQADCRLERELDRAAVGDLHHLLQPGPPVGVVERRPIAVVVPQRPALLAVDAVHVAVRRRVVGRHRREDLVVGVVEPAPLVLADVVVDRHRPAWIARLFRQERAHLAVGLGVVAAARAARRCACENRKPERGTEEGVSAGGGPLRHDRWIQAPLDCVRHG